MPTEETAPPPTPHGVAGASDPSPTADEPPSSLLIELRDQLAPRIQILHHLGDGGMGSVFLGRDPALRRSVAVKVLRPALADDDVARMRFAREAQAVAAISHPNIINIYDVGELHASKLPYFIMQFVDGQSVGEALKGQVASEPVLRRLVGEVASGLAAAHERGVVHRDVKPANVMIERATERAIVLDFGISAALPDRGTSDPTLTVTGSYVGTPSHMSPEQAAGEIITEKSDVYSLGVLAFELATGRGPFQESTPMGLLAAHINKAPPPVNDLRPELDDRFAALIDQCLAKNPTDRPSAGDVSRHLLPQLQQLLEWPPPGLDALRDRGRRAVRALEQLAMSVLFFCLVVYTQPRLATAAWRFGEISPFWLSIWAPYTSIQHTYIDSMECSLWREVGGRADCVAQPVDASPLWFFFVIASALAAMLLAARAGRRMWQLTRVARQSRRASYPWSVISAVTTDRDDDTSALLNGTGIYASVAAVERDHFLMRRRWCTTARLAGALAAMLFPWLWLAAESAASAGDVYWLKTSEVLFLLLPIAAWGVATLLSLPERRWRLRRHRGASGKRSPSIRADLAAGWLRNPRATNAGSGAAPRAARFGAPWLALLGVPALAAAVSVVIVYMSLWSSPMFRRWSTATLERVPVIDVDSAQRAPRWVTLDSQLGPFRILPQASSSVEYDSAGSRSDSRLAPTDSEWALLPRLPAATRLADFRAMAGVPSILRWREAATRAATTPSGDQPVDVPPREVRFPEETYQLAAAMQAAAFLDVARGDTASARRRLHENVAAAHALLRQRHGYDGGLYIALRALLAIAELERLRNRAASADSARRLADDVTRLRLSGALFWVSWGGVLTATPSDTIALREIRERGNALDVRLDLLRATVTGYCFNGRELVFGVSPARRELLARATAGVSDIEIAAAEARAAATMLESLLTHRLALKDSAERGANAKLKTSQC